MITPEQSEAIGDSIASVYAALEREVITFVGAMVIHQGKLKPSEAFRASEQVYSASVAIIAAWKPVIDEAVLSEAAILLRSAKDDIKYTKADKASAQRVAQSAQKQADKAATTMRARLAMLNAGIAKGAQQAFIKAVTA